MSAHFSTPQHMHSQRSGTIMDTILDAVDNGAKHSARRQRPLCGWVSSLDEAQVTLSVQNKQKHDFHTFLERSPSRLFCQAQQVTHAPYDTGYDLYEEVVMHGEIAWDVHLWTVSVRHQLHTFVCNLCGQTMSAWHIFDDCPYVVWHAWYVHIKPSILIPNLVPSWRHCVPTPWGGWICNIEGPIILTVSPIVGLHVRHRLFHICPTSFWISSTAHAAEGSGAKRTSLVKLLGSLIPTVHVMHRSSFHLQHPSYQEYRCTGGVGGMSLLMVANPDTGPKSAWKPFEDGDLVWPHPLLLHLINQRHGIHVVVQSSFCLILTPNELSPILFAYSNDFRTTWLASECGSPSLLLMDTRALVKDKGIFEGTRIWAMRYGYDEHQRYITCISQASGRDWFHKGRVLQAVLQVTPEALEALYYSWIPLPW